MLFIKRDYSLANYSLIKLRKCREKPDKLILAAEANSWGNSRIFRLCCLQGKAGHPSGRHARLQIKFVLSERENSANFLPWVYNSYSLAWLYILQPFWVEHLFIQADTTGVPPWRLAPETPPWLSHFSSAKAQSSQDRVKLINQTKRNQPENSSFVTFQRLFKGKFYFLVAMVYHLLGWKEKGKQFTTQILYNNWPRTSKSHSWTNSLI